jgi:Flp pilus assembly pilin Flp
MADRGQTELEYALFIGVVAAALIAMQLYVRRSVQANLKLLEEEINVEAVN